MSDEVPEKGALFTLVGIPNTVCPNCQHEIFTISSAELRGISCQGCGQAHPFPDQLKHAAWNRLSEMCSTLSNEEVVDQLLRACKELGHAETAGNNRVAGRQLLITVLKKEVHSRMR